MFIYQDLKRIDYAEALAIQTAAFDELLALKERGETGTSRLFFCEHNPVLTLGKHGLDANLLVSEDVLRRRGVAPAKSPVIPSSTLNRCTSDYAPISKPSKKPSSVSSHASISMPNAWQALRESG